MASSEPTLTNPWLVAAWPGMGSVALAAASYLLAKLGGKPIHTIVKREFFDINAVAIENGVVRRPSQPKSTIHAVQGAARDLMIFIGEAQPTHKGYEFCHEIVDLALARGVRRIVTFAAMATPVHPSAAPRVFGVASETGLLPLLARHDVGVLAEGQISGLNGVLLAAAAERGVEALCLLGELPFFAVGIPNPKASLAVLRAFSKISGVTIDLAELEEQSSMVERGLNELLERATKQAGGSEEEPANIPEPSTEPEQEGPSASAMSRIEELFRRARTDKSQALKLKSELDRLGLFKQFEDRFLDLFKKDEHG
jgi:predicted ATP-grasp superfamily ATP-dependent carboligase